MASTSLLSACACGSLVYHPSQPPARPPRWFQVPKTVGGKKKKKGIKLEGAMLGFASGTNYALLEQPE